MNSNQVALITGANKGLGLEIARQLGKQGIAVVLGTRDPADGHAAAETLKNEGIDAHTVPLDVTRAGDIAALPAFLADTFGRLDILVNNAGIMPEAHGGVTADTFRQGYETNVIGPYFIIDALLPLLQAAPAGRIVNHSSELGSLTATASADLPREALVPIYRSSKAALNMVTVVYAQQLKDTPIKVNSAHPGSARTDMNPGGDLSLEQGAQTAVRLATLPADGPTGSFFHGEQILPW